MTSIDVEGLRDKVKAMYREVADEPQGTFQFEMGPTLPLASAIQPPSSTSSHPKPSSPSPGVGHHLALAALQPGDRVVDLGSGSGMDAFLGS